ncbi:MAG: type II toxin-antitoxin system RelE/ParE family toxin [Deltaproteobacteria bacterium]|nr:type II toxin-antitoxin system RelE/ParE family toxin [Deltaproteobacteria bacterium]
MIKYGVFISRPANNDIREIVNHIRLDKPKAATNFKKQILSKIKSLQYFPLRGKKVTDKFYWGSENDYEVFLGEYLIVYRVIEKTVSVNRVLHGRMETKDISLL